MTSGITPLFRSSSEDFLSRIPNTDFASTDAFLKSQQLYAAGEAVMRMHDGALKDAYPLIYNGAPKDEELYAFMYQRPRLYLAMVMDEAFSFMSGRALRKTHASAETAQFSPFSADGTELDRSIRRSFTVSTLVKDRTAFLDAIRIDLLMQLVQGQVLSGHWGSFSRMEDGQYTYEPDTVFLSDIRRAENRAALIYRL